MWPSEPWLSHDAESGSEEHTAVLHGNYGGGRRTRGDSQRGWPQTAVIAFAATALGTTLLASASALVWHRGSGPSAPATASSPSAQAELGFGHVQLGALTRLDDEDAGRSDDHKSASVDPAPERKALAKKSKGPRLVGEGEKCNGSLPPQYATFCEEGLQCIFKHGVPGASGVCSQEKTKVKVASGLTAQQLRDKILETTTKPPKELEDDSDLDESEKKAAPPPATSTTRKAPTQASAISTAKSDEMEEGGAEHSLLAALSHRAEVVAPAMAVQDVADTLTAYVGLAFYPGHDTLAALGKRLENLAPEMDAKEVGQILYAYVGMKTRPSESLLAAFALRVEQVVPDMDIEDLISVLEAYAKLQLKPGGSLWAALERKAQEDAPKMSAHQVATTLTVCAQLGHRPSKPLKNALGLRAQQVAEKMEAQDVADTLNAYARLMLHPGELLLQALLLRAEQVAPEMNAKEVAGTLNAYARLEQEPAQSWSRPTPLP